MSDSPNPRPRPVLAALLGLAVVFCQLILAWVLSGQADVSRAYLALFQWDSLHYAEIVDDGYVCPPTLTRESPGNVAFFPGYPVAGWLLRTATGWTTSASLLVAAQLAAWGFWTYVFLLFQRWRVPTGLAALGGLLLASRPAAFFLIAAYSEPLFLMSLMGFIYWSGARTRAAPFLAALHGFLLTATRISGLPLVVYPILHAWLNAPAEKGVGRWKRAVPLLTALAVAASAALGAGLFFLYCHVSFGRWDLYMRIQSLVWNVRPDYLAFFSGDFYAPGIPVWVEGFIDAGWFCRFSALLLLPIFASFFLAEFLLARSATLTEWRARVGAYFAAWTVYYFSVSGTSRLGLPSMTRYALVPEVLLVLCLIHLLSRRTFAGGRLPIWLLLGLGAWVLLGFGCEIAYTLWFTHGRWVA